MVSNRYTDEIARGEAYSVKEAADRLHLSVWSIRSYIRDGLLDAVYHGRGYLVPASALKRYITENIAAPDAPRKVRKFAERKDGTVPDIAAAKKAKQEARESGKRPIPVPEPEPVVEDIEDDIEDEEEEETQSPADFGFGGWGR